MKASKESPIFILGNPRSGTSLLRLLLHTHSRICIPPESHFFLWLENKYSRWNMDKLDDYLNDLFLATKIETWELNKQALKVHLKLNKPENYAKLTQYVYLFYGNENGKKTLIWGDKNSLWIEKLNIIKRHFPNALVIHVIRDGRDVACSYRSLNKLNLKSIYAPSLPCSIEEIANIWQNNNQAIAQYTKSLKPFQYREVRYEDLIENTENVLIGLMNFLGLNLELKQLKYYNLPEKDIEPVAFLSWKKKLQNPPDSTNIGKYLIELEKNEIMEFNKIAEETLCKYNYL
jgi:hypothetical protein